MNNPTLHTGIFNLIKTIVKLLNERSHLPAPRQGQKVVAEESLLRHVSLANQIPNTTGEIWCVVLRVGYPLKTDRTIHKPSQPLCPNHDAAANEPTTSGGSSEFVSIWPLGR